MVSEVVGEAPKFEEASMNERMLQCQLLQHSLNHIPYLRIVQSSTQGPLRRMIALVAEPRNRNFPLQAVKADVLRVWERDLPKNAEVLQTMTDLADGFEIKFAFISGGHFLTGSLRISGCEA